MFLIITLFFFVLLGTVNFQQDTPILIMSEFCVYSVASALFMFPVLQNYYLKALQVMTGCSDKCTCHLSIICNIMYSLQYK